MEAAVALAEVRAKPVTLEPRSAPESLASLPPTARERRLALIVGLASLLVFAVAAPFATMQLSRLDAFIPVYQSVLAINDLITGFLLLGQFAYSRVRGLLVLACGYLFTALMAAIHMLSFPGLFAPIGLLGGGPQTTAWLYMFWHAVFPVAVIAYAGLESLQKEGSRRTQSVGAALVWSLLGVVGAAAGATLLATAGVGSLPAIMRGNNYTPAMITVVSAVWILSLAALLALWRRRNRSVLDLWLIVVMGAWLADIGLAVVFNQGRFDLGFYAGRVYGLLAASFVLFVLLYETIGLYGIARGVIDERTSELRRANAKLQALIDSSPLAIIALDRDCRVLIWGRAAEKTFGYARDEVIGRPYPLIPKGGELEFQQLFRRVADGGELVTNVSAKRQRKDGAVRDVVFSGAPLVDERGRNIGAVYALEDATDRKKLEGKLIQAQKMDAVGQLTGGLAHDFNNLLGIIIGNLEILGDDIPAGHPLRPLVDAAMEASLRGAELNKSLLAFSRQQQLEPRLVEINPIVEGMTKLLRRTLGEHIQIELHTSPGIWPTLIDPAQLESAILNLAVNARDAMPEGGRLVIETSNVTLDESYVSQNPETTAGDYALVAVSDSGNGMAPDILARVFEPFFTTKEVGKGTGLGLSMVYGFVKQSNGHVKIYSEPGHGTTIRIYLPRSIRVAPEAAVAARTTDRAREGETVLVVEDDVALRRVTLYELSRLGYRVIEADSPQAALDLLDRSADVDLLFSDVVMPGAMDGVVLAQEATRRRPGLRVLLTSGFTERAARRAQAAAIPWRILSKPYRREDLARTLREVMGHAMSKAERA